MYPQDEKAHTIVRSRITWVAKKLTKNETECVATRQGDKIHSSKIIELQLYTR